MKCYPCREHPFAKHDLSDRNAIQLITKAAHFFGLEYSDMIAKDRTANLVMVRMMIADILTFVPHYKLSSSKIGTLFNRDHSSILHYLKKVKDYVEVDEVFRDRYKSLHFHLFNNFSYYRFEKLEI